jgi:hypothetical protein
VESDDEESVADSKGAGAGESFPVLSKTGLGKVGGVFGGTRSGAPVTFT